MCLLLQTCCCRCLHQTCQRSWLLQSHLRNGQSESATLSGGPSLLCATSQPVAAPNNGVGAAAELAPKPPNPKLDAGEELAPKPKPELCNKSNVIFMVQCVTGRCAPRQSRLQLSLINPVCRPIAAFRVVCHCWHVVLYLSARRLAPEPEGHSFSCRPTWSLMQTSLRCSVCTHS